MPIRGTILAFVCVVYASAGCHGNWQVPEDFVLVCESDTDCPTRSGHCVEGACQIEDDPICGNGVIELGESCDLGTSPTEPCPYGEMSCVTCIGLDYRQLGEVAIDLLEPCEYRRLEGQWCGDGIVQQRGLVGGLTLFEGRDDGLDTGQWEACDPGLGESPAQVACSNLHPALGEGMATCDLNCMAYDTSGCDNDALAFVPAGPFMMGCNSWIDGDCTPFAETPYHEVYLDAFVVDTHEVRADEYKACVDAGQCIYEGTLDNPACSYDNERDAHPINCVTWGEAAQYCQWQGRRLLTEAEWEKAARGTDGRLYPWGPGLVTCARAVVSGNYDDPDGSWMQGHGCGIGTTSPVGSRALYGSPYGALDMIGNVWEWVADWFGPIYYYETPSEGWINPRGPETGAAHTFRGGSWRTLNSQLLRTSFRDSHGPSYRSSTSGFRCGESSDW